MLLLLLLLLLLMMMMMMMLTIMIMRIMTTNIKKKICKSTHMVIKDKYYINSEYELEDLTHTNRHPSLPLAPKSPIVSVPFKFICQQQTESKLYNLKTTEGSVGVG